MPRRRTMLFTATVATVALGMSSLLACAPTAPEIRACDEIAAAAERIPAARVQQRVDSFPAFRGEMRHGCVVEIAGPLSAEQPIPLLVTTFPDSLGPLWERDDTLVADGPAVTIYGLWRESVLCTVRVDWSESGEVAGGPRRAGAEYSASAGCEPPANQTAAAGSPSNRLVYHRPRAADLWRPPNAIPMSRGPTANEQWA